MRRILLTFALMAAGVSGACAFEQTDTIVNVCDAKQVSVVTSDSLLEVNINGQKDNPSYRFNFRHPLSERATTVISESSDWDFSFFSMPGSKKWQPNKSRHLDVNTTYIDLGLSSTVNADSRLNVNMGSSWEIYLNLCSLIGIEGKKSALNLGFGFGWRNFRLKDDVRFCKTGNKISLENYPENAEIDFSRVKLFHMSFPLSFSYALGKTGYADIAVIPNLNTYASIKTRYKLDGDRQKISTRRFITTQPPLISAWRCIGKTWDAISNTIPSMCSTRPTDRSSRRLQRVSPLDSDRQEMLLAQSACSFPGGG